MITEVMTLLIAVGAVMIFVVWNQAKKRRQTVEERREVEESTGKLKQELEKTATEIIGRMESQVSNLEDLLDEAEKNRTVLEGRVAELRKLLKRSEGQSTEIRDLLAKIEEAGETVEELQHKLEMAEKKITMQGQIPMQMPLQTMMPMSSPMMTPMMTPPMVTAPLPNVPSPISPPPILSTRQQSKPEPTKVTKAAVPTTKAEIEPSKSAEDSGEKEFAKVLKKTIEEDEVKEIKAVPKVPDRRSIVVSSKSNLRANVVNRNEPVKIETNKTKTESDIKAAQSKNNKPEQKNHSSDSAKIKEMLLNGMSVEEISRETKVGRGAIELIQEMTRRKLERKT